MVSRVKHTRNGKLLGVWYETEGGNRLYLAHRTGDQVYRIKNAWCFDVSLLERCRAEGVVAVGVVRRANGQRMVWLTHVEDFFNSPYSFAHFHECRQRGLPLPKFRIDPAKSTKYIESAVKLR